MCTMADEKVKVLHERFIMTCDSSSHLRSPHFLGSGSEPDSQQLLEMMQYEMPMLYFDGFELATHSALGMHVFRWCR